MFLTTGILEAERGIFNFQNGNSRWPWFRWIVLVMDMESI